MNYQRIYIKLIKPGIFDLLNKLNENSVNLSKEEIKILIEIKNLLLQKGINENPSLNRRKILYSGLGLVGSMALTSLGFPPIGGTVANATTNSSNLNEIICLRDGDV